MLKKVLMLLMVTVGLAWSAAVQATPIAFSYTNYYALASAQNTVTGNYDKDIDSQSSIPISAFAEIGKTTAYASGGMEKFLFAEASESGKNRDAQSWVHADLRFVATTDQVCLKFDYYVEASTTGNAGAWAQLHLYLEDLWTPGDIIADASSSGNMSDFASTSGSVNEVLSVTPGQEYQLWLEIYWVDAEGYDNSTAYAQAWIDNFSFDDGTTSPPPTHAPAPATWLLLSSGLAVVLGWRSRR